LNSKLPLLSGKDLVRIFCSIGYAVDHQTGSHVILRHPVTKKRRTIPNHPEIAVGTLRAIIRQAGLTREEFMELVEML